MLIFYERIGPVTDIWPSSLCGFYVGYCAWAESVPASFHPMTLCDRPLTVKLSKIMSASFGGYKPCHITAFFPVAAKHKGDSHSSNGKEQNDSPAASTSTVSVIEKDIIFCW
ncbi:hypothetical protein ATANTOWER_007323 [Ataeniobius toweri]|uniref:Uncharacterized protein n=1 Tax=Ataeniobius toweri TaxID=208326 RepID=A0ABU7BFY2_9TELE|nr:hypothetical protein [Ataeniobius toweri]